MAWVARGCIAVDQTRQCRASVSGFDDRCRSLAHVPPAAGRVARAPGGGRALVGREPREKRSHENDPPKDEQGRNDPCGGDRPLAAGARKTAGTDPLASHPLTSTSADVHAGRGGVDTSHRDGEYAKFRAVLRKNFTLKTRGSQLWCTILEVLVPVAFIALMCLPRLFISDESVEMTLHRPAPIQSITWSGRVPGGPTGDGPYRLLWSPDTNADAERVAESAAIDLLCGGGFMTQVALASSVELDQDAIAEHGILDVPEVLAGCRNNPGACAGFVKRRGGVDSLGPDSAVANPLTLAWLCTDSCLARRECYRPVIDEFLVGFPTETAAMAHAMTLAERGRSVAAIVSLPATSAAIPAASSIKSGSTPRTCPRATSAPGGPARNFSDGSSVRIRVGGPTGRTPTFRSPSTRRS